MKYRFVCNHGGKPRKASSASSSSSSSSISPSKKRKRDPSKMIPKVDCPAKIDLYKYSDDSYEAVYYWYHHNHDPTNSESIIASRLPEEARKWIIERVDKNMDWEAIQNALCLTPALDKDSVRLWLNYLDDEGYDVLSNIDEHNNRFTIAWISKWQKPILQRQDIVCVGSTHKTCKSFIRSSDSCYLFTIVCKNFDTNKGCPVGFMITNSETTVSVASWFEWLKSVINFVPKSIMIDCSPGDVVQVLLCHWHIKRAWEKHIKKMIKVENSTHETKEQQRQARNSLNLLMNCDSIDLFEVLWDSFKSMWHDVNGYVEFYDYMYQYWYPKREKWCKAWRPKYCRKVFVIFVVKDIITSMSGAVNLTTGCFRNTDVRGL
ncbi:hypothetical protein BDC45DRAFT_536944 [Circinella umbellata]|nr:hypothetical protein BDC45DRAFT_536944 [Circinella umbellata]